MSKAKEWGELLWKLIEDYEQRIAELERQVAALTPGRGLAEYLAAMSERDALRERVAEPERQLAAKQSEPPPDGHAWRPVDADHPLTAADDGRTVLFTSGQTGIMNWVSPGLHPVAFGGRWFRCDGDEFACRNHDNIVAVLRPKPAPEPPKPLPGEVWESVVAANGGG